MYVYKFWMVNRKVFGSLFHLIFCFKHMRGVDCVWILTISRNKFLSSIKIITLFVFMMKICNTRTFELNSTVYSCPYSDCTLQMFWAVHFNPSMCFHLILLFIRIMQLHALYHPNQMFRRCVEVSLRISPLIKQDRIANIDTFFLIIKNDWI